MAVSGYVLIEAEVGHTRGIGQAVVALRHAEAKITKVDTVTGPYDVIVQIEADDLDKLGRAITEGIQNLSGVKRTTTCLAIRLGR